MPSPPTVPSGRAALVAARLLAVGAAAACVAAVVIAATATPPFLRAIFGAPEAVVGPSFAAVGAMLIGLPAARRIGWLLLSVGSFAATYVLSLSLTAVTLGYDGTRLLDAPADGRVDGWLAVALWLTGWT